MIGSIHPLYALPVHGVNFTCSLINAQTVLTQLVRLDFKSSLSLAQSINAKFHGYCLAVHAHTIRYAAVDRIKCFEHLLYRLYMV